MIQITLATNFWMIWSQITLAQVIAARDAHAEAVASVKRGDGFVSGELEHALVAIVGAAFAVDGFYGATKDICNLPQTTLDKWASRDTSRTVRVFATLQHGFVFDNDDAARWRREMGWLFALRDRAAHHEPEHLPSVYRPELESGFSTEHLRYTAEAAERAARLAFDLIETCIRNPRPRAREWAGQNAHVADIFAAHRAALST